MGYIWNGSWKQKYKIKKWPVSGIEVMDHSKEIIKVNTMVRFGKMFSQILNRDEIVNIVFHYLAELDRKSFVNRKVFERELILEDIAGGRLGNEVKEKFNLFEDSEKEIVLNGIIESTRKRNQYKFFEKISKKIFPDASRLYYFESCDKFFIYLGTEDTVENREKIEIIKNLFWDITSDLEIFYDKHFGVIGIEETMRIGEIELE